MAWAQLFCEVSHNKYVTLELNCKAMKQFAYLSIHVDHLLLMNKFQKMCTLCENCEPKEGQIE